MTTGSSACSPAMNLPRTSSLRSLFTAAALAAFTPPPASAEGIGIEPPYTDFHVPSTLAGQSYAARIWDDLQRRKDALLPITLGAWHWWRIPTGGPGSDGYGSSSLPGTYYYYLMLDPWWETGHEAIQRVGLHTELRSREENAFRGSNDALVWLFEMYAWASTPVGVFKAGQIRRKFGIDWDGSFYGNVAYYDGFKLNSDIGVSWERTFWIKPKFSIDAHAQFFLREDGISSGLVGADSESTSVFRLQNNAVFRIVPTWWFSPTSSLALGLSASIGQMKARNAALSDHAFSAWGVDLTYTRGRFKAYVEVLQRNGAVNPVRYVSGGMSSQTTDFIVGLSYITGPVTWRAAYSAGFDQNPGGHQQMYVPGATIAITKNIDLYLEYVFWRVAATGASAVTFENGFQVALNWRF